VVSSDSLANAAWDDDPPAGYLATLHVFVANLRKALRDVEVDPRSILMTVAPGYRLVIDQNASDYGRFVSAYRQGQEHIAAGSHERARLAFRAGLDEFSGDVLADLRGLRFADEFANAVEEMRTEAYTGLMSAEIACGRASSVIAELSVLADENPLREPLWVLLVTALYTLGRQSDALDACRRVRETLAEELGIDPGPQLRELESKILRQERLVEQPVVAMASTVTENSFELGAARLRAPDGDVIVIPAKGLRFGRMPDNDVVVTDPKASRYHAAIHRSVTGFVIRDLRSANGVAVAGRPVIDAEVLADGDDIRIGSHIWTFEQG
jgi:DNA-binding SARP family transcriptional activator